MQSPAFFQNIYTDCTFLLKFSNILLFSNIFWFFFWKVVPMPVLTRISPAGDILKFDFLEKGLEIASPQDFVYDFSRKMFLMLYSITDYISLSDCLYFLRYWAICVSNQAIFLQSQYKNLNILRMKIAFKVK